MPDPEKIRRNVARLQAAKAPPEEIERYLRSEGATPEGEGGFRGAGAGGPIPPDVSMPEGVALSAAQGPTLGFADEGMAAASAFSTFVGRGIHDWK